MENRAAFIGPYPRFFLVACFSSAVLLACCVTVWQVWDVFPNVAVDKQSFFRGTLARVKVVAKASSFRPVPRAHARED